MSKYFAHKWLLLISNKDEKVDSPNIRQTHSTVKTSGLVCSLQRLIVYVNFLQSIGLPLCPYNCWQTQSSSVADLTTIISPTCSLESSANLACLLLFAVWMAKSARSGGLLNLPWVQWPVSLSPLYRQTEAAHHQYQNDQKWLLRFFAYWSPSSN